jgi:transcriptional regulator with XRE-family HTH domain
MNAPDESTKNVKQLRESKKLTVRKVCAEIDVAESTVLRWEAGTMRPHLPLEKVQAMLNLFECDFPTLYAAFQKTALEHQESDREASPSSKESVSVAA